MSILDDVLAFKSSLKPIAALWSVNGEKAYGNLLWVNEEPRLFLTISIQKISISDAELEIIPIYRELTISDRPTITAAHPKLKFISLEVCLFLGKTRSEDASCSVTIFEFELLPTAVWAGAKSEYIDGNVTKAHVYDTRLTGFFGSPNLKAFDKFSTPKINAFAELKDPISIWAIYGISKPGFQLGETDWTLSVQSDKSQNWTATSGFNVQSTVKIAIQCSKPTTISRTQQQIQNIEQMLSIFSIDAFKFQIERYITAKNEETILIWRYDNRRTRFEPPMHHQILVNFREEDVLGAICKRWFDASPSVSLSRWLFVRALNETDDGIARFIFVAQAFEVLGRDATPKVKISKDKIAFAVDLVEISLSEHFDNDYVTRIKNLIQSSNQTAFKDMIFHLIEKPSNRYKLGNIDALKKFSKNVSDVRNTIVHMSDKDRKRLDGAFAKINKLGSQLCSWYALCQAEILGVETNDIVIFLSNNRSSRFGMPNDTLRRLK